MKTKTSTLDLNPETILPKTGPSPLQKIIKYNRDPLKFCIQHQHQQIKRGRDGQCAFYAGSRPWHSKKSKPLSIKFIRVLLARMIMAAMDITPWPRQPSTLSKTLSLSLFGFAGSLHGVVTEQRWQSLSLIFENDFRLHALQIQRRRPGCQSNIILAISTLINFILRGLDFFECQGREPA